MFECLNVCACRQQALNRCLSIFQKRLSAGDAENRRKHHQHQKDFNVLWVLIDSKLQWNEHVAKAISKSNYSLNGLKLIRKYFSTKELVNLVTSNYFSFFTV
jgi:hypothetical protein